MSARLSVTRYPEVFVIGDMAHALDGQGNPLSGLAPVAMQQGQYVGRAIAAELHHRLLPLARKVPVLLFANNSRLLRTETDLVRWVLEFTVHSITPSKDPAVAPKIDEFSVPAHSDFAAEHVDVGIWIEQSSEQLGERYYHEIELKSLPSGQKLLDAKPEVARRYVMAAVEQACHWDRMAERIRGQAENDFERVNGHLLAGWYPVWGKRTQAVVVIKSLTRRKLPFDATDVVTLLKWCTASSDANVYQYPLPNLFRVVEQYAKRGEPTPELRDVIGVFAERLSGAHDKTLRQYAALLQQLWDAPQSADPTVAMAAEELLPAPKPAMAGHPCVLVHLKRFLKMWPAAEELPAASPIGPDAFPMLDASPLRAQHELLSALYLETIGTRQFYSPDPNKLKQSRPVMGVAKQEAAAMFLAAAERHAHAWFAVNPNEPDPAIWQAHRAATAMMPLITSQGITWTRDDAFDAILYIAACDSQIPMTPDATLVELIDAVERFATIELLSEGERFTLLLLRAELLTGAARAITQTLVPRLSGLIRDGAVFCLVPGEVWADEVNQSFSHWSGPERQKWAALFTHLRTANSSRPSGKWLKEAAKAVEAIGEQSLAKMIERWLPLVSRGRSIRRLGSYVGDARGAAETMIDENATVLRGLLWLIPTLSTREELSRLVTDVTLSSYKKVPGVGPRAVKVGNAGVYALSELGSTDAVGQLAVLKVRVKFGTAQKEIEKAFNKTAKALDLPRDEIEEMGVPSYGLTEVGRLCEPVGDYTAEILVNGADALLQWHDAQGKPLKSVPSRVSKEHAEELKELRQALKDIKALLPAQRDRIDSMFLAERSWPFTSWRNRYLEHPLVGTVAARLIWCVDEVPVVFQGGKATTSDGKPLEHGTTAEVTLWHPVGRPVKEVVAWRERLESLRITQPFKQAHREIYLLTAAEQNTRTYSNRFAAHVLRQHQFHALCAARGWKNQLRLLVDSAYSPPTKSLPLWNLRAEFWVEGVGDDYGTDTNESGSFHYLVTDQVRFYSIDAAENLAHASGGGYSTSAGRTGMNQVTEPLPLDQVPPLVFSEIMRDVDLFVGVASVGNDPNWQDGGPEGRHRDYWNAYSFGDLSESASTRKSVLERLVPRLKIADRCSLVDRFLIVRGDIRTYKIHLGSGNILMEPNDAYLCIVPDAKQSSAGQDLYLPFEGDRTLSIILSKALLLAADTKITDPTIVRQIKP